MNSTRISTLAPWGTIAPWGHRVLCSDGIVRAARMAPVADTFFSVPASVRVKGKTVSGFVTTVDVNCETVYCFHPYTYRRNHSLLPPWPDSWDDPAYDSLIANVFPKHANGGAR